MAEELTEADGLARRMMTAGISASETRDDARRRSAVGETARAAAPCPPRASTVLGRAMLLPSYLISPCRRHDWTRAADHLGALRCPALLHDAAIVGESRLPLRFCRILCLASVQTVWWMEDDGSHRTRAMVSPGRSGTQEEWEGRRRQPSILEHCPSPVWTVPLIDTPARPAPFALCPTYNHPIQHHRTALRVPFHKTPIRHSLPMQRPTENTYRVWHNAYHARKADRRQHTETTAEKLHRHPSKIWSWPCLKMVDAFLDL